MSAPTYEVLATRKRTDQVAIKPLDGAGGMKGRVAVLCDNVSSRWSGRYQAYVMSLPAAEVVKAAVAQGWKGRRRLTNKCPAVLVDPDGFEFTYNQAKKILLK